MDLSFYLNALDKKVRLIVDFRHGPEVTQLVTLTRLILTPGTTDFTFFFRILRNASRRARLGFPFSFGLIKLSSLAQRVGTRAKYDFYFFFFLFFPIAYRRCKKARLPSKLYRKAEDTDRRVEVKKNQGFNCS